MARPDGRIEKGQRLSSAISARAWNRAQEAADLVLGVTPGVEAVTAPSRQRQFTFPVRISGGTSFTFAVVGTNISVAVTGLSAAAQSSPYSASPVATDQSFPSWSWAWMHTDGVRAQGAWGICESLVPSGGVADCVFSGLTYARVKMRNTGHRFAVPSQRRENTPATDGCLESSECQCDGAAAILGYGQPSAQLVVGNIYWALILL